MKILVPMNDRDYLHNHVSAGADEFYLGFHDHGWEKRFGRYADINRMSGFGIFANQYSFEEAIDIISEIKALGKAAFLTLNANSYTLEEREYICDAYFPAIAAAGTDGIIVSEMQLAVLAVRNGIDAVASTMCAVYNSDIAEAYVRSGVRRIIIPRDVSLDEISLMCSKNSDIEYEVFFMRNGCVFSDCYCLGFHRPECGATCGFLKQNPKTVYTAYKDFNRLHDTDVNDFLYNTVFHDEACGMCALYRLKEAGVGSLKIVGRADFKESVTEDIALTKENLEILSECKSEKEYLDKMRFPHDSIQQCRLGFSCYYPEVRF